MPTLRQVEEEIFNIEDFRVRFRRRSPRTGRLRDARADMRRLPPYDFTNRFPGERTVLDWIAGRIDPRYSEHELVAEVLYEDGSRAPGQTLVQNVRATYPRRRRNGRR